MAKYSSELNVISFFNLPSNIPVDLSNKKTTLLLKQSLNYDSVVKLDGFKHSEIGLDFTMF